MHGEARMSHTFLGSGNNVESLEGEDHKGSGEFIPKKPELCAHLLAPRLLRVSYKYIRA